MLKYTVTVYPTFLGSYAPNFGYSDWGHLLKPQTSFGALKLTKLAEKSILLVLSFS
jgi:hypothetical protein